MSDQTARAFDLHRMLFDLVSGMIDTKAAWIHVADACCLTPERAQEIVDVALSFPGETNDVEF